MEKTKEFQAEGIVCAKALELVGSGKHENWKFCP